ncbi:radical SAM protein [Rhodovibrio salinarum]|uniref:Radical SAM protein n=1 Tax=Rhodovibrio salinarum TaxID=1087 RepID=A0A934QIR9_9PROT|nr:radical SAM protein [Rhodovibrio salinarum]MBK1697786.1 radical SAM protein [Rhodovibrio salinarum]
MDGFEGDGGVGHAQDVGVRPQPATPGTTTSGALGAPLYLAWQLTNECNFACLHCIEESGPGRAFKDELSDAQAFDVLRQAIDLDVPYISLSGGEPMVHPRFFDLVEYAAGRGAQLKIETNGQYLTKEACQRLKELDVKSVQVSMDGASRETFNKMRVRGDFDQVMQGIRNLVEAGVPLEINYSPTKFNTHEIARAVDLAHELGAQNFYTGRTMYTGNAVKTWQKLVPNEDQYMHYFNTLYLKRLEYIGRMRVHYHELGLRQEMRERLENPAALLIVLPNGLVKLINALPFICGDLRTESLAQVWSNFQRAWQDPRVADFVTELEQDSTKTAELHRWIYV